jgi:cell division transport system permease protein
MYLLKQAFSGIKRAGFMSVACILITTFSLLIFGIFLLATANLREVLRFAHEKVEIVAFLEEDITAGGLDSLEAELDAIPFIQDRTYVSPGRALDKLRSEFGTRSFILDALEENPMPASFEITLKPQYRLKDRVISVAERIIKLPGVEDVSYGRGWITRLENLVKMLALIDICVGLVVGVASIVTVSYTVRLTLFARKEQIRVLKLVGATDWFVMLPFLLEGVIHGLISVVIALFVVYGAFRVIEVRIPQAVFMPFSMILFFAIFGVLSAVLGSWVSLKTFLRAKD